MAENAKSGLDYSAALLAIQALRTNADYRAAEVLRRANQAKLGKVRAGKEPGAAAKAMVAKQESKEYAAIALLIGTWNTIGRSVRLAVSAAPPRNPHGTGDPLLDAYLNALFETIPLCSMYRALKAAMDQLTQDWGEEFAPDFEWLYQEYQKWLNATGKNSAYIARHCSGIRANFG